MSETVRVVVGEIVCAGALIFFFFFAARIGITPPRPLHTVTHRALTLTGLELYVGL
jgi:hypothetical protein